MAKIPALTGLGSLDQAWKTRARSASSVPGVAAGLAMGLEKLGPFPVIVESSPGTEVGFEAPPEGRILDACNSLVCGTLGVSGHPESPSCTAC